MEYRLVIEGTLPNLNDYISSLNVNKYRGAELKRKTEKQIKEAIKKQLKDVSIDYPVTVNFTWIEPNKKRDKDNIASAKKFIFDALVASKVLKNDGWEHVDGFTDAFEEDKVNPRVEVVIRPAI